MSLCNSRLIITELFYFFSVFTFNSWGKKSDVGRDSGLLIHAGVKGADTDLGGKRSWWYSIVQ